MKKNVYVAAIVVVLVIVIGGAILIASHGNNKTSPSTSASTSSSSSQSSKTSTNPTATDKVSIQNFAFSPTAITVKVGTTVTWTNQDSTAHTVTETDSQTGPASSDLEQGAAYSFTFKTAGTYHYHCSIHPDMVGTVTVTE